MTGRRGEHLVSAFLYSIDWQCNLVDALGYDLIATQGPKIIRVQVKSSTRPITERGKTVPRYTYNTGHGGAKSIERLDDQYDVLALCGLRDRGITFYPVTEVTTKTIRIKPEEFGSDDTLARHRWSQAIKILEER